MNAIVKDLVVGSKVNTAREICGQPRFSEGEVVGIVYRPFKFGHTQADFKVMLENGRVIVAERAELNRSW